MILRAGGVHTLTLSAIKAMNKKLAKTVYFFKNMRYNVTNCRNMMTIVLLKVYKGDVYYD